MRRASGLGRRIKRLEARLQPEAAYHVVSIVAESEEEAEAKIFEMTADGLIFPHSLIISTLIVSPPERGLDGSLS